MTLTPNTQITQANVVETEVQYEVWGDGPQGDFCAGSDSLSDAMHYAAVYGQDGPVVIKVATTTRVPYSPALSPPAEGPGMAANEVGAWIAKRDSEYEAALADLTQPPCIDSVDDFGRTIYSALEDCPAMSVDKQADFIARAFWPLIATPTHAQPDTGDVAALREAWPVVTDAWADTYCALTNQDPDGIQGTFMQDGYVETTFRDKAKRQIEAMLCAAPKAAVRQIAALSKPNAPGREG